MVASRHRVSFWPGGSISPGNRELLFVLVFVVVSPFLYDFWLKTETSKL
jgi:hypothetical protein